MNRRIEVSYENKSTKRWKHTVCTLYKRVVRIRNDDDAVG